MKPSTKGYFLAGIILSTLTAIPASAAVISVGGGMNFVTPQPVDLTTVPLDVLNVYEERSNFTLTADLGFDLIPVAGATYDETVDVPGAVDIGGDFILPPGLQTFGIGTIVNSHLVHLRSLDNPPTVATGSVTFDAPIVGVMLTVGSHDSSNYLSFAVNGVGGLEPFNCAPASICTTATDYFDSLTFSPDLKTLSVVFRTGLNVGVPVIYESGIRVLTLASSPVPVPPALWLFGSGLIGLVGMARRKKA